MPQKNWNSLEMMFEELNKSCNYLVMRNYESLTSNDIFLDSHEDIDFLCDDYKKLAAVMDALPRKTYDNKVQYYILLNNTKIKIDIRHVGDKYYDPLWAQEMLENKTFLNFFYVMNKEDYFYSLIYHAILQKKTLSEEYCERLQYMAQNLGITAKCEEEFLHVLQKEMSEKKYKFYYPEDPTVPNRFKLLKNEKGIEKSTWYFHKLQHILVRMWVRATGRR